MKGQTNAWLKDIVSGEKISIILTTNQSSHADLMGAVITVSYAGNLTEFIWNGDAIQTVIPPMTDYTVSYSDVNGYSTPEPFSGKAMDGRVSEVIGTYNTELVTVNVSADEGEIGGYEVTISKVNKYGSDNEYMEVEYIEAAGSQYIDTGFKPNQNTRLVMDFENVGDYSGMSTSLCPLFGARNSTSSAVFALWIGSTSYPHYGNVAYNKNGSFSININSRLIYDFNKNIASIGSSSITCTTASFTTNYNLCILGANTGGTIDSRHPSGKLYSCQIYDNGTLVRDYVPVVKTNGVAGLYDKVNNVFYPSNSSTAFVAGDKVGEVIAMQTTSSASYKIPYGTLCTIKASDISSYITPTIQSFTASQVTRNVDVIYSATLKGVFIQDIYGRLYTKDEWDGTQTANGIAVLADEYEFVVAKEDISANTIRWGGYGTDISTLTNYTDAALAATDFDGVNNTSKIIAAIRNRNDGYRDGTAAGDCAAYTFPNGKTGYLGAAGEWQVARQNKDELNSALTLIGGTRMTESAYWTSTEYSSKYAWLQWFDYDDGDGMGYGNKTYDYYVRALTPYIANPVFISFTIMTDGVNPESCVCRAGMTWGEWANSGYNTTLYYVSGTQIVQDYKGAHFQVRDNGVAVSTTDVIKETTYYAPMV